MWGKGNKRKGMRDVFGYDQEKFMGHCNGGSPGVAGNVPGGGRY